MHAGGEEPDAISINTRVVPMYQLTPVSAAGVKLSAPSATGPIVPVLILFPIGRTKVKKKNVEGMNAARFRPFCLTLSNFF